MRIQVSLGMAHWVKHLPCKHEDVWWIPGTYQEARQAPCRPQSRDSSVSHQDWLILASPSQSLIETSLGIQGLASVFPFSLGALLSLYITGTLVN